MGTIMGRRIYRIERVHGRWGMSDMKDDGEHIMGTAKTFDCAIVNTFFEKKVSQFVTYNSGGREIQIYFLINYVEDAI